MQNMLKRINFVAYNSKKNKIYFIIIATTTEFDCQMSDFIFCVDP